MAYSQEDETQPPMKVLIVDDDEGHAEALADGLEIEEGSFRIENSGRAGIKAMEEETYDAVLTDLVMHDVDGIEVLRSAMRLQPEAAVLIRSTNSIQRLRFLACMRLRSSPNRSMM